MLFFVLSCAHQYNEFSKSIFPTDVILSLTKMRVQPDSSVLHKYIKIMLVSQGQQV